MPVKRKRRTTSEHSPLAAGNAFRRAIRVVAALTTLLPYFTASSAVQAGESAGVMRLHYQNGLLSASIENVPLRRVLTELERRTAIEIRPDAPATGALTVTVTVQSVGLADGLKKILEDLSYVMDNRSGHLVLHLLSTKSDQTSIADTDESRRIASAAPAQQSKPRSLEEYRSVPFDDAPVDGESDVLDEVTEDFHERRLNEFLLERALDALHSNEVQLHEAAIDALAEIDDERAASALADIALGTSSSQSGSATEARVRATATLSKRTAGATHLDDASLISVFEQLALSDEEAVRDIALVTLEDIRAQNVRASELE